MSSLPAEMNLPHPGRARPRSHQGLLERLAGAMGRAYTTVEREHVDVPLERIAGRVPEDLEGVLYRNGPGRFEMGGRPYHHPFDGDGMIARLAIQGGQVRYTNRFVETQEFLEELSHGQMRYRSFGTPRPGGLARNALRTHIKNAANTSVVRAGDELLALWEGGLPHALDPRTLETRRREDFDGALQNERALDRLANPELPFSAHPRRDPDTGTVYNFGLAFGARHRLMLYELSADGALAEPNWIPLDELSFMHDFALTPNWRVFLETPVSFRIGQMLGGWTTPAASLKRRQGRPMRALLISRHDGQIRRVPAPPGQGQGFVFHLANGFEDGDDRIIVDGFRMQRMPPTEVWRAMIEGEPTEYPSPQLMRYTIDLAEGEMRERPLHTLRGEFPVTHPRHHGRPYRYVWGAAVPPGRGLPTMTALARWDTEAPGQTRLHDLFPDLPGEPIFAPRSTREDDGWLLSMVYRTDSHRTDLVILDAQTMEHQATLALPHHLPPGFHGTWAPGDTPSTASDASTP